LIKDRITSDRIIGLALSLGSHVMLGLYVVMAKFHFIRYPPFALLSLASGCSLLITVPILGKGHSWHELRRASIWLIGSIAVIRSITKMLAVQYTEANFVQLIDLFVPLLTALLGGILLKEKLPPNTIPAIIVISIGTYMVITVDPFHVRLPGGDNTLLGLGLAAASSLSMAALVVATSFMTRDRFHPSNIYIQSAFLLFVVYALLSWAAGESLDSLLHVRPEDIPGLALFIVVVGLGGVLSNFAISKTHTAVYSTMLSSRLVVTLIVGRVLLEERLESIYQIFGALIVIVALTIYLLRQAKDSNLRDSCIQS
jgi:drug/metabolite transporter (DMT)-like permease